MKILIVNYRYFISGGPERYLFNLKSQLENNGHEVIPFSINYSHNVESEYSDFFVPPLSDRNEVYFRDQSWSFKSFMKTLERAFYSPEVYKSLARLVDKTKPDFAVVLHFKRKLSPAVLKCLHDNKLPFVVRVSDFSYVCPNAHLIKENRVCEDCIKKGQISSVRNRCVQGSLGASVVNYAAERFHQLFGYYNLVPMFVVPSRFTMGKMAEGGIEEKRLFHLPTFVNIPEDSADPEKRAKQIVYVGRLEPIKGLDTLLEAVKRLADNGEKSFNCVILGEGSKDYVETLKTYCEEHGLDNVSFGGRVDKQEVDCYLSQSLCSVVPSLWYENLPNAMLESMALATPVIASAHGSLAEHVKNGVNGYLFEPGQSEQLAEKIKIIINNRESALEMGANALSFVKKHHSPQAHVENLLAMKNKLFS